MGNKHWIYATLNKKQISFIDKISRDCRFSGGKNLCRTEILRAFLTVAKKLRIDISNIKSESIFKDRILESFKGIYWLFNL